MIHNRKMNVVKRIAFAANDNNRKSLIEWSYYNQDILKNHELIATGPAADILEGTVGVSVNRLPDGMAAANQQLISMVETQQVDILLFFWDPIQPLPLDNGLRLLHDTAITNNVIVACNMAAADFVLSSPLMQKNHYVPVLPPKQAATGAHNGFVLNGSKRVVMKVNTIN